MGYGRNYPGVAVGGSGVFVGGSGVFVGGSGVFVGGTGVGVTVGTGVLVGGTGVFVGVGTRVGVLVGNTKILSISAPSLAPPVGTIIRSHW